MMRWGSYVVPLGACSCSSKLEIPELSMVVGMGFWYGGVEDSDSAASSIAERG
jgi:hypothetical protein